MTQRDDTSSVTDRPEAGNMDTGGKWREQWARVLRWHDRFGLITRGRNHNMHSESYTDEVYAFFQNCHHFKDWLTKDCSFPADSCKLDGYINCHTELRICADICNASKHLRLDRPPRSTEAPRLGGRKLRLTLGRGTPQLSVRFVVDTNSGPRDAFELAGKCVDLWRRFLEDCGESI